MKIIVILLFYCLSLWINNIQTQNVPTITDLCKFESIMPLTDTIDGVDIDLSVNNTENNNNNNNNNNNIIPNNNYCTCETEHSMPWGLIVLDIDCRDRQFQNIFFNAEILPPNTERIDLSWNAFEFVPDFIGIDLKYLIITHNLIKIIDDNNFDKISLALIELDLSWNHIEIIAINAFNNLLSLNKLDLSGNNLKQLTPNVFSTLPSLKQLILSKNLYLNETFHQTDMNLYLTLGVTTKLQQLEIEECNLNYIDLSHSVGLQLLNLKYNNFNKIPIVPYSIEFFDFSGNRIEQLGPKCLPNLFNLKTLLLEDMTNLTTINDYAFFGLPNLKHISLEGSKKLTKFNSIAFGLPMVKHEISSDSSSPSISTDVTTTDGDYHNNTFANDNNDNKLCLEILNLRGTKLKTLNSSLLFVFENLQEFHLDGNPFVCNCDVKWLKDFHIETNAQCDSPPKLKGATITKLPGAVFLCKRWTEWVYKFANGLLILLLLILCGVATWLIVMGIRPSRRSKLQKVGALSPYARVTIEPNRAEDNF